MDVDVISQGREPERDFRLPQARRWRGAGAVLAVVAAGLAVTGLGMRHGAGLADAPPPAASAAPQVFTPLVPGYELPLPQSHPATVVCSPSSGSCSMRIFLIHH
jgi:hypothetical protein